MTSSNIRPVSENDASDTEGAPAERVRLIPEAMNETSPSDVPVRRTLDVREIIRAQSHKRGVAAIVGRWPGTETDEEIEAALRELR